MPFQINNSNIEEKINGRKHECEMTTRNIWHICYKHFLTKTFVSEIINVYLNATIHDIIKGR